VAAFFEKELRSANINTAFRISYRDTTADKKRLSKTNSTVLSAETPVNFASLNDYDKKYLAVGIVQSPSVVLLGRMWLAISASVILLVLTLFCLYRMYRIILRQKKLDQLKDDFISNMTHELKTPIATVSAAIDGLQYYEALEDRDRTIRYLNASRAELNKLDEMVSKVLELSTSESGDQPLRKEHFLLRGFLEDMFSSFRLQPSFSWQMNINEDLHVWGDRGKLESVFANLISNAIKYGHNTVEVSVSAYEENKQLRILFADNGPGINSVHLPYLFNKFYRGDPGFSSVKGFGLGLFYVKNIIIAHGGEISAYNEKGLRFLIQLPKKA